MTIKPSKETYNDIAYNFFNMNSDKICFMFSGTGYNYDKPLMHYSTSLMLDLGYDVVQVFYTFEQQQFNQPPEAISEMVYNNVESIVTYYLHTKAYKEVVYIGKSLGVMPIADYYMQQKAIIPSHYVLLTPPLSFEHTMQNLVNRHSFIAIGTADPHFSNERLNQLTSHQLTIVENANHSLEIKNNTLESIITCQTILTELKNYLQNKSIFPPF
ncbi:hypothetical protein ACQKNX_17530 [Lysinibacillus sp. NPDC093712]|uniref:hypothetical protein n=1 Tax=Lysinibacillus sp. NPDC093712 TaxID=3390579 RepID=UPI003D02E290